MALLHSARVAGQRTVHLTPQQVHQTMVVGHCFLESYMRAHLNFVGFCPYKLFNMRPKFHALTHFFERAQKKRNPMSSACYMDEQWIKNVINLSKHCHRRTVHLTTLQRYCAGRFGLVIGKFVSWSLRVVSRRFETSSSASCRTSSEPQFVRPGPSYMHVRTHVSWTWKFEHV